MTRLFATSITWVAIVAAAGCSTDPDGILIELAPDVVSSEDGTIHVRTLVVSERSPQGGENLTLTTAYTDRNGVDHAIDPVSGKTDENGAFEAILTGFDFDGAGTITATLDGTDIVATASFAVLDRTAPVVTILPPTSDLRVGPGFPLDVQVEVTDEIGVSSVLLEADGELNDVDRTVVSSGSMTATVTFDFEVPDGAASGPTITLYALAEDLSGNIGVAEPVVLTVDPTINIAVAPGLSGSQLTSGNGSTLDDPRALALSPKDGLLYVADNSQNAPCNDRCIRRIDPANGSVLAGAVVNGVDNSIEGLAFDATGDNLYYSDRQNRVFRLTHNGTAYVNPTLCNEGGGDVQDPFHLVVDPTNGIMVVEQNDRRLKAVGIACDGSSASDFSNSDFADSPWGVAAGASGEFYVSEQNDDEIYMVDGDGDVSLFEHRNLDAPRGLVWLDGGASDFADSLLIADTNDQEIVSSTGVDTARHVVLLRNDPVDVELDGGTLYILTRPSAGDPGRVFVVTGF